MNWRGLREKGIEFSIRLCGVSSILFVFAIFYFVARQGADFLFTRLDLVEFFTSAEWRPTDAKPVYGALSLINGTVAVMLVSMTITMPLAVGGAIYISEFCGRRARETLKVVVELLAAVPSVVWGFIGITVMSDIVVWLTGATVGVNVLNAGIVLALMSVPIVVSIAEDALKAVPDSYREAAEALGATRWQTVYRVLFPAARHGLLAAVLLGVGRVIGETMAVLMCTGHSVRQVLTTEFPFIQVLSPARTLTATIAAELGETVHGSDHYQVLFVIGLLLFAITFAINLISDLVVHGVRKD